MMNANLFEKICSYYELGQLTKISLEISGGILHSVWCIHTTTDKYAVKIIDRTRYLTNTNLLSPEQTNEVAKIMGENKIPTVLPLEINNHSVFSLGASDVVVMPWIKGKCYPPAKTTKNMAKKIGHLLRQIHDIKLKNVGSPPAWYGLEKADWKALLKQIESNEIRRVIESNFLNLVRWSELARKATDLFSNTVFSHRDLDSKNILWYDGQPTLLDWEYAGLIHPLLDILIVGLNFSGVQEGQLILDNFIAFLRGYRGKQVLSKLPIEIIHLYYGYCLDWIVFAAKGDYEGEIRKSISAIQLVENNSKQIASLFSAE